MILYHGSYLEIDKPDLRHSRDNVDFGRGFYTTPIYEQAAKWCGRFKRQGKDGIVSKYKFDMGNKDEWKVLEFESYSEEWLDFILNCRRMEDKTEAINRLRYEKPNLQICFRSEEVIKKLQFEGSELV